MIYRGSLSRSRYVLMQDHAGESSNDGEQRDLMEICQLPKRVDFPERCNSKDHQPNSRSSSYIAELAPNEESITSEALPGVAGKVPIRASIAVNKSDL